LIGREDQAFPIGGPMLDVDRVQKPLYVPFEPVNPLVQVVAVETLVTQLKEDLLLDGFIHFGVNVFQKVLDLFLIHCGWHTDLLLLRI
jgi:hypothetical protein